MRRTAQVGGRHWLRVAVINIALTGVFGIVALGALELWLRWTIPDSSGGSIFQYTLDTKRYKVMKPNASIIAWGSELRTNDLGFRDDKQAAEILASKGFRVAVLGDSFTVSAGVDYDKIYTSLLQSKLQDEFPGLQVLNLAVGGYSIVQYELVLREVALGLKPDLIVVSVFPFNDLDNDTYRANYAIASGQPEGESVKAPYEDLYVYRAYISRVVGRLKAMMHRPAAVDPEVQARARRQVELDKQENLSALERIVELTRSHGIDVLVTMLPNTDDFHQQEADFAPFEDACRARNWDCVNLLPSFAASGVSPQRLRLNVLDPHPNDLYNQMVADFLLPRVADLVAQRQTRIGGAGGPQ